MDPAGRPSLQLSDEVNEPAEAGFPVPTNLATFLSFLREHSLAIWRQDRKSYAECSTDVDTFTLMIETIIGPLDFSFSDNSWSGMHND